MKYILRGTKEEVDVIAYLTGYYGERSSDDWVSYIDKNGSEHIKEKLSIDFDFIKEEKNNIWDERKYELVKVLFLNKGYNIDKAISTADNIISRLK